MSDPAVPPEAIREIAAEALPLVCTICGQHGHEPCRPAGIMHLARFSRARDQGRITTGDFDQVLEYLKQMHKIEQFYSLEVPLA